MADLYYTITSPGESKVTEKMSRFLGFALHAASAEEAREIIRDYQNRFHDARHVCWAYMIGPRRLEYQLNDNGEPSGTAGKPILGQINSFSLTDTVVIVVRYFGGIKLGTSGLIAAYREAAREAIEAAVVEERHEMSSIRVSFPYMAMNDVMKLAKQPGVEIAEQTFDNTCFITLSIRSDKAEELRGRLTSVSGVTETPDSVQ